MSHPISSDQLSHSHNQLFSSTLFRYPITAFSSHLFVFTDTINSSQLFYQVQKDVLSTHFSSQLFRLTISRYSRLLINYVSISFNCYYCEIIVSNSKHISTDPDSPVHPQPMRSQAARFASGPPPPLPSSPPPDPPPPDQSVRGGEWRVRGGDGDGAGACLWGGESMCVC